MGVHGGNRFLLTAAMTRYSRAPDLDRPEVQGDRVELHDEGLGHGLAGRVESGSLAGPAVTRQDCCSKTHQATKKPTLAWAFLQRNVILPCASTARTHRRCGSRRRLKCDSACG